MCDNDATCQGYPNPDVHDCDYCGFLVAVRNFENPAVTCKSGSNCPYGTVEYIRGPITKWTKQSANTAQ